MKHALKIHKAQESREYPNLLVQNFGGSKPQNISQLNSDRRGLRCGYYHQFHRLGRGKLLNCQKEKSIFTGYLTNRKDVKPLLSSIIQLYRNENRRNTVEFREERDNLVAQLADCVIDVSFELQNLIFWKEDSKQQ